MFKATAVGFIGRDPEQRTYNDQTVTSFSVAARTSRKDKETGEYHTEWVNVSMWGKRGDFWYQNLKKGTKVIVMGELTHRVYQDKDGETRVSLDMSCDDIEVCSQRATTENAEGDTKKTTDEMMDLELPF